MAAVFPEWMMGLPPGWVTGVPGLSRSAQLRAIGNGVVPAQAAMAVAYLYGPLEPADRPPASSPAIPLLPTMHGVGEDAHGNELNMVVRTVAGLSSTARSVAKHRGLRTLPTPQASDAAGGRVDREVGGTRPSGAKRSVSLATAIEHARRGKE